MLKMDQKSNPLFSAIIALTLAMTIVLTSATPAQASAKEQWSTKDTSAIKTTFALTRHFDEVRWGEIKGEWVLEANSMYSIFVAADVIKTVKNLTVEIIGVPQVIAAGDEATITLRVYYTKNGVDHIIEKQKTLRAKTQTKLCPYAYDVSNYGVSNVRMLSLLNPDDTVTYIINCDSKVQKYASILPSIWFKTEG